MKHLSVLFLLLVLVTADVGLTLFVLRAANQANLIEQSAGQLLE